MARDTYEIGSSPNGEDCAQAGSENYGVQTAYCMHNFTPADMA